MKKFHNQLFVMLVLLGVTFGFVVEDPFGSKSQETTVKQTGSNPVHVSFGTPLYTDNFDGANDTTALRARGYLIYQNSNPRGTTFWFQGNETVFPAYNGPATGYVGANFNATAGVGQIDVWMVLPKLPGGIIAGDSLFFYSRTSTGSAYPDSIRVLYSATDSVYSGSWVELGRFIVSNAGTWEKRGFRSPAASINGRFAIRYCVANGGPSGSNSNFIGIDALTIERNTVLPPVPTGTWTEQNSGLTSRLSSVSAINDDIAWTSGSSGKVLRTTNKGVNWVDVSGNMPLQTAYTMYAFDVNTCLVSTSPSTGTFIYKTTNGGTNWVQVFSEPGGFGDGFYFLNSNTGFFYGDPVPVGGRWSLWKTTNAGTNWDSTGLFVPSGGAAGWNNGMSGIGNKIWFGSNSSSLNYSSNGGLTWTTQSTPALNQYCIWFNNDNFGLSAGTEMYVTTNSGTNWGSMTTAGTGEISGITGAQDSWWFCRQSTNVYFSSNNGANWALQYTAPAGNFYHMTKSRSGATIWGIRNNGGISRYGQPIVGINSASSEVPANYSLSQNYPNPFNPVTKINYALPKAGIVTIKVFDILGKEVATLVNEVKNAGIYSVDFNGTGISSGMYFYKISVNGFNEVKKMMLLK